MRTPTGLFRAFCLLSLICAANLSAAPTINGVANAASNIAFNSPVAPGGIFVIYGTGLGPANLVIAQTPFHDTTLSGTSIAVTVGSTTVNALMYYTSATQVAALLPSNTPLPTTTGATFTVTYNGQSSTPVGHGIAQGNLGIFTIDSSGQGPGIVTFADYSLVSASKSANCGGPYTTCGSANPGDTLILWGTGLGPVSGDDAAGAGLGQNMPNVPLTLWLGGVKANILYQGRSGCCIGEDQIVFTVPDNVPKGCAVPLVVQIGTSTNTVSNTVIMPVAAGSRNCSSSNPAFSAVDIQQGVLAGPVSFGTVDLNHFFNDNGTGFQDSAAFQFGKFLGYKPGSQPFFASYIDDPPLGTCIVSGNFNNGYLPFTDVATLDGGASITIKGPNGTTTVQGGDEKQVTFSAAGTFLVPGAYTVTGTGGKDVGTFTANITIPPSPTLLTPTPSPSLSITRANGLPVTWNANGSNGHVDIFLSSALDNTLKTGSMANCRVAANAGSFTIPPYVLLALPAGNLTQFEISAGAFSAAVAVPFTASGINLGILHAFIDGTNFGGFALR